MGIQKNEKIIANFIQKMEKRKLPFNDFSITKATAPWILAGVVDFILQYFFLIDIIYCDDKSVGWKCSELDIWDV